MPVTGLLFWQEATELHPLGAIAPLCHHRFQGVATTLTTLTFLVDSFVELEERGNRDLEAPVPVVDEWQIAGFDPAIQRRMTDADKSRRQPTRDRLPELALEVTAHDGEISIPGRTPLSPPQPGDVLEQPQPALNASHRGLSVDQSCQK